MQALGSTIAQFSLSGAARWMGLRRVNVGNPYALAVEPKGVAIHHAIDPAANVAKPEVS